MSATILLVEDNPQTRKLFRVTLELEHYHVIEAADAHSALAAIETAQPQLAIVDYVLPDRTGAELVAELRARVAALPVIMVSGLLDAWTPELAADRFMIKPVDPAALVEAAQALVGRAAAVRGPGHGELVVVLDADGASCRRLSLALETAGFTAVVTSTPAEALEIAAEGHARAIVSDLLVPGIDGLGFARLVRARSDLAGVPVVLVSALVCEREDVELARAAGACDLVRKGDDRELARAVASCIAEPRSAGPVWTVSEISEGHRARLAHQLRHQAAEHRAQGRRLALANAHLALFQNACQAFQRTQPIGGGYTDVLAAALDATGISCGALYTLDGHELALHGSVGFHDDAATRLFGNADLLGSVSRGGVSVLLSNAEGDEAARSMIDEAGTSSLLLVPLVTGGQTVGVLALGANRVELASAESGAFVRAIAGQLALVLALSRSQLALATSRRRLEVLFDRAHDAVATLTPEGKIIDLNQRWETILGRGRAGVIGRSIWDFATPASSADLQTFSAGLADAHVTATVRGADGADVWLDFSNTLIELDGQPVVFSIGRDVTAELGVLDALRQSEVRYAALVDHLAQLVWEVDGDGQYVYLSSSVRRIAGARTHAALQDRGLPAWLDRVHDDDRAVVAGAYGRLAAEAAAFDIEYRWRGDQPSWLTLRDRGFSRPSGSDRVSCGVVTDITDMRALEQTLRQAQKLDAVGHLAGGVAHDFNNMLAVVMTSVSMVLDALPPDHPTRDDLQMIQGASERAATLTRQLLVFSKRDMTRPEHVGIADCLEALSKMLRRVVGEHVTYRIAEPVSRSSVLIDPGQLEQIMMNLVVNARDAMPLGGTLTLEVRDIELLAADTSRLIGQPAAGAYVRLGVTDTGHGMSDDVRAHIFEPFFTTKGRLGTGLGLATLYGIVMQARGGIEVRSEPGRGTTFEIYLPRTTAGRAKISSSLRATRRGDGTCILLVEDDATLRHTTRRLLHVVGYSVVEASDGAAALEQLKNHPEIKLVLSDVVMPVMNGVELARRLTTDAPHVTTVLMSGYAEHAILDVDAITTYRLVHKPFSPAALLETIHDALHAVQPS